METRKRLNYQNKDRCVPFLPRSVPLQILLFPKTDKSDKIVMLDILKATGYFLDRFIFLAWVRCHPKFQTD